MRIYQFGIESGFDFDCKNIIPAIKRTLKGIPLEYYYSLEQSEKWLHVHIMLALETKDPHINPSTVFYTKVKSALEKIDGVEWCSLHERKYYGAVPKGMTYHHNINQPEEFSDAIERYSYLAKTNDKANLPSCYRRSFDSSRVQHNTYYNKLGIANVLKIDQASKNSAFHSFGDGDTGQRYIKLRQAKPKPGEVKKIFHISNLSNSLLIGYYGFYYSLVSGKNGSTVIFSIDDFFIDADNLKRRILGMPFPAFAG